MKIVVESAMVLVLIALFGLIAAAAYNCFGRWLEWPVVWSLLATVCVVALLPASIVAAILGAVHTWNWSWMVALLIFVGCPVGFAYFTFALFEYIEPWWRQRDA